VSRAGCFPTAIFRAVDASQGLIDFIGALGGIRTPDPQIRSKVLSPVRKRHHTTATDADPYLLLNF
jgi:hypothetical protein